MEHLNFKSKAAEIIESYFLYFCYRSGLVKSQEINQIVKHREKECENCPLKKGGWCSKRKSINVRRIKKVDYSYKFIFTKISGCGCWLKSKLFSKFRHDLCPLNKWKL